MFFLIDSTRHSPSLSSLSQKILKVEGPQCPDYMGTLLSFQAEIC